MEPTNRELGIYSKPVSLDTAHLEDGAFARADVVVSEVAHDGPSFEGRIYFNNPDATVTTGRDPEQGYAGSFNVFGHHGCGGDVGHCDYKPRRAFDPRKEHHMKPQTFHVIATRALARLHEAQQPLTSITVVPVMSDGPTYRSGTADTLRFGSLSLQVFR